MMRLRTVGSIYVAEGRIENGTFQGRWHFSFDEYEDPRYRRFGRLRVFNDDTLSPGAVWPLHAHREIEVVTYCAGGEFRHADERGKGGILRKGWVQHTTVGTGMMHSEINNLPGEPMRFIQMWFLPSEGGLEPSVGQMAVERPERTGLFLPLVSADRAGALPIRSEAEVFSCFLPEGAAARHELRPGWGAYLYVLEGGPVAVDGRDLQALGAAMITEEPSVEVRAGGDAELLLVGTAMG